MRTTAYVCFSLFCFALAFHLGAVSTGAGYVDHSMTGIIAASQRYDNRMEVLDENGVMWKAHLSGGWSVLDHPPIPVSASEVKFWLTGGSSVTLVTYDDHVWVCSEGAWNDCGAWPGGSLVSQTSWGSIKARYLDGDSE